ncbi:MAG: PIN domain-containing protein, partial [Rhodoferax sp.]|nr:PIN domain-containing protein [Rhodoferax sp.]
MILVDSSVWIDYFRGASNQPVEQLVAWLKGGDAPVDLGVADLVVFEVMRGFASPIAQRRARDLLLGLDVVEIGGLDNALRAAEHYSALRAQGYTVRSPIDVLLASYCIAQGHMLLHRDADFDVMAALRGLQVV